MFHPDLPPRRPEITVVSRPQFRSWRDVPSHMNVFNIVENEPNPDELLAPSGDKVLRVVHINKHRHLITREYEPYDPDHYPYNFGLSMPSMFR